MNGLIGLTETCREFKKEAIEILGTEQSVYELQEFHGLYDVAIITATIDEFESVKRIITDPKQSVFNKNDSTIYFTGEILSGGKSLKAVIPFPYSMGIEAASTLTTKVVGTFRPKYIFMCGICAGNKNICKIGDIIIAEKSLNYHGVVEIQRKDNSHDKKFNHNISAINGHLKNRLEIFSKSGHIQEIQKSYFKDEVVEHALNCRIGLLVTGSSMVRSSQIMNEINSTYLGVKGLDMETYGVYYSSTQVFKDYAPNFVSIKSVSDYGDDSKDLPVYRRKYALFTSSEALSLFIATELL